MVRRHTVRKVGYINKEGPFEHSCRGDSRLKSGGGRLMVILQGLYQFGMSYPISLRRAGCESGGHGVKGC